MCSLHMSLLLHMAYPSTPNSSIISVTVSFFYFSCLYPPFSSTLWSSHVTSPFFPVVDILSTCTFFCLFDYPYCSFLPPNSIHWHVRLQSCLFLGPCITNFPRYISHHSITAFSVPTIPFQISLFYRVFLLFLYIYKKKIALFNIVV